MKKLLIIPIAAAVCLSSCSVPVTNESSFPDSNIQDTSGLSPVPDQYEPINYIRQTGLWIPYMEFEELMYGRPEDEYRRLIRTRFTDALSKGVNTIYFHVHPNGDAYYDSQLFPKGVFSDGSYDPLSIAVDEAHKLGLSIHAWLNPLRLQTVQQLSALPDSYITKQWADDAEKELVREVNGRYYLNPAYSEVSDLISAAADEILDNYNVDGIHIDDYFYPTTDPEFDRTAFEASGASDLSQWRRDNVSRFVKKLYDTVKSHGDGFRFGISPQGNIDTDYNTQYADVRLWGGTKGYADYIVPQIYYGFQNEYLPFESTLRQWEELVGKNGVSLIIGLAPYKQDKYDQWAGILGENEWIDDPDVIKKQIELVKSSLADGYALYE
ncbi:MAG: family 10 glycosylhydrolase [Ruminococcus sp.]|nr:family 10 glycosylhydrolase [Ruminococcus sp.]